MTTDPIDRLAQADPARHMPQEDRTAEDALLRTIVTSRASEPEPARPRRSRRRVLITAGVATGLVVVVLAILSVVNVFGPGGPSIVDKAIAALDPSSNTIMHVKISGQDTGPAGAGVDFTEESWTQMNSPHAQRSIQTVAGQPDSESLYNDEGLAQIYEASTNTIYRETDASLFKAVPGRATTYGKIILQSLHSGLYVEDGTEVIDGRECVRFAATKDYGTAPDGTRYSDFFYVDAKTSYPVELRQTREGGKTTEVHFEVYELLPINDANLALLDLSAQHPGATTVEDAHPKTASKQK